MTLVATARSFLICDQKVYDMNRMLDLLNYQYLLCLLATNIIWVAYSLKGPT